MKRQDRWFTDGEGYTPFLLEASRKPDLDVSAHFDADRPLHHVGLVHYLLRSAVVLHRQAKNKDVKQWLAFSQQCYELALATGPTLQESQGSGLPLPRWAELSRTAIADALRSSYPMVDQVRIVATTDARLHARTFHSTRTIQVSALMREYLRSFNLFIWNIQFTITERPKIDLHTEISEFTKVWLEHVVTLYRGASPSSMAVMRAYSEQAFFWTLVTTGIQLNFILAHEYAHIVLHGGAVGRKTQHEDEADAFAVELLLGEPFCGEKGVSPGDLWMAIDWLFGFMELERIIGAALNEYEVDWDQSSLRHRRDALRPFFGKADISRTDNNLAAIGSLLIRDVKNELRTSQRIRIEEYSKEWLEIFGYGVPVFKTEEYYKKRLRFHDKYGK
ncbi:MULTISPECIES: ImmA/IrrE family metallo-endopeptidase [Nocardia]|uniref:ImmA/IrrE family metallo-endopeptidase n=1 Tax=Nocardia TaxID=1817 RepID=UPI000D6912EC|nr:MULTISPECIES: hypothetical protein [Nocardia]